MAAGLEYLFAEHGETAAPAFSADLVTIFLVCPCDVAGTHPWTCIKEVPLSDTVTHLSCCLLLPQARQLLASEDDEDPGGDGQLDTAGSAEAAQPEADRIPQSAVANGDADHEHVHDLMQQSSSGGQLGADNADTRLQQSVDEMDGS